MKHVVVEATAGGRTDGLIFRAGDEHWIRPRAGWVMVAYDDSSGQPVAPVFNDDDPPPAPRPADIAELLTSAGVPGEYVIGVDADGKCCWSAVVVRRQHRERAMYTLEPVVALYMALHPCRGRATYADHKVVRTIRHVSAGAAAQAACTRNRITRLRMLLLSHAARMVAAKLDGQDNIVDDAIARIIATAALLRQAEQGANHGRSN